MTTATELELEMMIERIQDFFEFSNDDTFYFMDDDVNVHRTIIFNRGLSENGVALLLFRHPDDTFKMDSPYRLFQYIPEELIRKFYNDNVACDYDDEEEDEE